MCSVAVLGRTRGFAYVFPDCHRAENIDCKRDPPIESVSNGSEKVGGLRAGI